MVDLNQSKIWNKIKTAHPFPNLKFFPFSASDKPPIEELHQFLEFQLPRQWAPVFSDLPLGPQRRQQSTTSLQFSLMGPKLYVNTTPVKLFAGSILFLFYCVLVADLLPARIHILF